MKFFLIVFFMISAPALAADCPDWYITWPHNQVLYRKDKAPEGAFALPKRQDGSCVELADLVLVDGIPVEDAAARQVRMDAEAAAKTSADAARANRLAALRSIDTAIDNAATLAQVKTVVKQILKAIVVEIGRD